MGGWGGKFLETKDLDMAGCWLTELGSVVFKIAHLNGFGIGGGRKKKLRPDCVLISSTTNIWVNRHFSLFGIEPALCRTVDL